MFDAFSESARRVIFLARYEAGRLKFDEIDLQHLLLGFIFEDQGNAQAEMQKNLGIEGHEPLTLPREQRKESFLSLATAELLRTEFSTLGPRIDPQPMHGDMMLTTKAREALSAAFEHAKGSSVSPLHLLWEYLLLKIVL